MTETNFTADTAELPSMPAITWLNMSGDVTITWDEANKAAVQALVEQKMAEGYSFFILKPRMLKFLGTRKERLNSSEQFAGATGVVVPDDVAGALVTRLGDESIEKLVREQKAQLTRAARQASLETTRRAVSASEVLLHQSVAVRPIVAG